MKMLLVYPNQQEPGCKPPSVAMLAAAVKARGHDFKLIDMTEYEIIRGVVSKDIGEKRFEYKRLNNPERLPKRLEMSFDDFKKLLANKIETYRPEIIGFTSISHFFPMVKRLSSFIKSISSVPIIVGGVHPTTTPDSSINDPNIDMICLGEGEAALVDLLDKMDRKQDITDINNIWVKKDGKIYKNRIRPVISDLDVLPFPDWEIFPEIQFYKPYMGNVYKYGDVEKSRGCPFSCAYCFNQHFHNIYGKQGFYRTKSVNRLLDELVFLKETYSLEFIRFWDELFVHQSNHFREFSKNYQRHINLPFSIETTAQSVNNETALLLKDMNCKSASIGFETGSEDLRKRILNKNTKNSVYRKAFKTLKRYGIRTVAFIMLAIPEDNLKNYFDTIRFLKEAEVDSICIGFLFPFQETKIRTTYSTLYDRLYPEIDNELTNTKLDAYPILSDVSREMWRQLADIMPIYKETPEWIWPLVNKIWRSDDHKSLEYGQILNRLIYKNKFGEWPDSEKNTSIEDMLRQDLI